MNQPVFLTLCDKGSKKVKALYDSLDGNLITVESYSNTLKNLSKIFNIHTFLKDTRSISDTSIIVFTDAYDVLCMRSTHDIIDAFISTEKDIIFGAELGFSHHSRNVKSFFDTTFSGKKLKYLNGGFIIAYKWAYLKMLDHIVRHYTNLYETPMNTSDQRVLSKFMVYNDDLKLVKADLDTESRFVFNYTHSIPETPISSIQSYFVHVTDLKSPSQLARYSAIHSSSTKS